jgi:hypothetical protein
MKVTLFALLLIATHTFSSECIQIESRYMACPNLKYKGVYDQQLDKRVIKCFCMTDMRSLFKRDVTALERVRNKMELKSIYAKHQINEQTLRSWLSDELQSLK